MGGRADPPPGPGYQRFDRRGLCQPGQSEFTASKRTASRDLEEMVANGIIEKIGTTGKGVRYILRKGAMKGPRGPKKSVFRKWKSWPCNPMHLLGNTA
jgi:hypothetical protein